MKTLIAKLVWPAYLAGILFLSYAGITSYINASAILEDHTVVDAPIELIDTTSRTKRGHTSTTYIFNYTYTAEGNEYVSEYSAVNEKGERYIDNPVITVAYSNADPSMVGALHVLERQSSLWGMIKGVTLAVLLLGLVALFVYAWASPDDDDDDESEDIRSDDVTARDQSQTA